MIPNELELLGVVLQVAGPDVVEQISEVELIRVVRMTDAEPMARHWQVGDRVLLGVGGARRVEAIALHEAARPLVTLCVQSNIRVAVLLGLAI